MVILMADFVWRKTKAVCVSPFPTMREGKWSLVLILTFLVACELFLPVRGVAQSFTNTGLFYFTGAHRPLRTPIFREFMDGDGLKV
ncbi:MAG: hypothetical protein OEZ41_14045, partial [Nitrospirota bacterium]|nr:hypothetical protein [Nitrospirota bacterium]